jgi:hypothetical protein
MPEQMGQLRCQNTQESIQTVQELASPIGLTLSGQEKLRPDVCHKTRILFLITLAATSYQQHIMCQGKRDAHLLLHYLRHGAQTTYLLFVHPFLSLT